MFTVRGRVAAGVGGGVRREEALDVDQPPSDCGRAGPSGANIWARSRPTPVVMMFTMAAAQGAFTW